MGLLLLLLISLAERLVFFSLSFFSLMADTTFGLDGQTDTRGGDGYFSCHVPFLVKFCQLGVLPPFLCLLKTRPRLAVVFACHATILLIHQKPGARAYDPSWMRVAFLWLFLVSCVLSAAFSPAGEEAGWWL